MQLNPETRFPLRFSSIFRLGHRLIDEQGGSGRFRYHNSHVFFRRTRFDHSGLLVASRRQGSSLRNEETYKLEGPVMPGLGGRTTLFEEATGRIRLEDVNIQPASLVNGVTTNGIGKIGQVADQGKRFVWLCIGIEILRLPMDLLDVNNVVGLRGNVVGYDVARGQWEIMACANQNHGRCKRCDWSGRDEVCGGAGGSGVWHRGVVAQGPAGVAKGTRVAKSGAREDAVAGTSVRRGVCCLPLYICSYFSWSQTVLLTCIKLNHMCM
ncbi:uncharacterized protein MELLADRAFT_105673 [Melampsora larici-populina 98AG31]|uniref:Uncharacterized protein n=1 Tax=Melampsora larici-populina (strain 98AG31 / pathotype 3-4-7) TaxID=747676 RepID=F4RJ00_MELLP|nr:uncharacterized protein MELLADRAFT_105673 [Melampsora larici-populina 98AG31]EGG07741.1 hypothetical protein MELLADRAFT_105673 [Melampsora larici-populina 98AG31]